MENLFSDDPYELLAAMRFMHKHADMTFHVAGDDRLMVSPAHLARRHASKIRKLKTPIIYLLRTPMTPVLAERLMHQATQYQAERIRGVAVEVIDHLQCERPEIWEKIEAAYDRLGETYRAQDWPGFIEAVCKHLDLYETGKRVWQIADRKEKEAAA